ncbi:hypothetical protein LTR08_004817 [Meristemomyces frigidus]|nr:hypothetical protein LTR08_004817 [Meristemomyces frigidus]
MNGTPTPINHIHNPHCKDFGDDPPFRSYSLVRKMLWLGDYADRNKRCVILNYSERDCKGKGHSLGEATETLARCIDAGKPGGGRSERVKC